LRADGLLPDFFLLSPKANQAAGLAAPKRRQNDHFLLQLLGVAKPRQESPLLQEHEDDRRNGDEDGQDGDNGKVKKIQKFDAVFCYVEGHHCCRKEKDRS
jgi:hypothetical protein